MKNILITIVVVAMAGVAAFIWYHSSGPASGQDTVLDEDIIEPVSPEEDVEVILEDEAISEPEETEQPETERPPVETIGVSAGGYDIVAHHFGTGDETVLFVGGIHGGYAYNTSLLAYELIDHLESNPALVPDNLTVSIIPILNPDGIVRITGTSGRFERSDVSGTEADRVASRFNANNVDLNRNFDCQWQAEGTWRNQAVSGGSAPFSEPESRAIQGIIQAQLPTAVIAWYAAAGEVFASACGDATVLPQTTALSELYATASGYSVQSSFEYYTITGDMMDWLASNEIPAISVLLNDRENTEWSRNRTAIEALLNELGS